MTKSFLSHRPFARILVPWFTSAVIFSHMFLFLNRSHIASWAWAFSPGQPSSWKWHFSPLITWPLKTDHANISLIVLVSRKSCAYCPWSNMPIKCHFSMAALFLYFYLTEGLLCISGWDPLTDLQWCPHIFSGLSLNIYYYHITSTSHRYWGYALDHHNKANIIKWVKWFFLVFQCI